MTVQEFKEQYPEHAHLQGDALWDMMSWKLATARPFQISDEPGDNELVTEMGPDGMMVTMTRRTQRIFEEFFKPMKSFKPPYESVRFQIMDLGKDPDDGIQVRDGLWEQMRGLTRESIETNLKSLYYNNYENDDFDIGHRNITLHTGAGGADLFEEKVENHGGLQRIYIGKKVMRLVRRVVKHIHKSHSDRYYFTKPI